MTEWPACCYRVTVSTHWNERLSRNMRKWQPLCRRILILVGALIAWMYAGDLRCESLCMHEQTSLSRLCGGIPLGTSQAKHIQDERRGCCHPSINWAVSWLRHQLGGEWGSRWHTGHSGHFIGVSNIECCRVSPEISRAKMPCVFFLSCQQVTEN